MSLTIGLQVVILDILAYNKQDQIPLRRKKDLVLMEAWNRVILSNRKTQATILIVGLVQRISPAGYEVGNEILNKTMEKDMDWWEALFFIAVAMGQMARKIIRPRK